MTQTQFINALSRVRNSYSWKYSGNTLVGVARYGNDRGKVYNPVTALARTLRVGNFTNTVTGTRQAASRLGLTTELVNAILSGSNRGHAQIVRGKMIDVLPV